MKQLCKIRDVKTSSYCCDCLPCVSARQQLIAKVGEDFGGHGPRLQRAFTENA